MERWNALPLILRKIIAGFGCFVIGAAVSFGYSYRPLHGALTFKVDSLESRLDERNQDNSRLKDELARISKDESVRIDPERLAQVESELTHTKRALRDAEKKTEKAEGKRRTANANSDRWRKRFESLRDQHLALPAVKDPSPSAAAHFDPSAASPPRPALPASPGSPGSETQGEKTQAPSDTVEPSSPKSDGALQP